MRGLLLIHAYLFLTDRIACLVAPKNKKKDDIFLFACDAKNSKGEKYYFFFFQAALKARAVGRACCVWLFSALATPPSSILPRRKGRVRTGGRTPRTAALFRRGNQGLLIFF